MNPRNLFHLLLLGFFVAFAGTLHAQWTGALTGTANDADHSYTRTVNWTSLAPEMTWDSTLLGATTLYFGANFTTAGTWNLNPAGNFALTLQGGGLVAPNGGAITAANRTVILGGNVSVDHTGSSNRSVFLGSTATNNQLALDLDGVQRTFTVASGSTLSLRNTMLNAGLGLIKEGGGTLRLEGNAQSNLGGTVRIDTGVLDVTTLGNGGLGTATFQLNGGIFHLRSNATDVNYGNNFTVTANSTFEYDSTASGNSNPRRFIFGGIDIQGAHTLNFDNNNGGWYHFNGPINLGGAATFLSNSAEGQSRPVFVGAVNDNGFGFTKTGTGLIDLANSANDITGPILVSQGQVLLRNAGAIGTPSSITLGSGVTTGFLGFLANDQTFSQAVTLGTANSGFSAGGVQAGTNFILPGTAVATLSGTINQGGLALGLAGGPVGGVLRLDTGNRTAETGGTLISGTVHASQMNNFSGGNLNITTGGALVIDPTGVTGPTWAQFLAARPTWGTGDGEVQLTGGFFAAKNGTVTINLNDITGAPANFFDANYTLGSLGRDSSGQIYTDGSIRIDQDTTLTAVRNFTISTTGPGRLGDPTGLPVMEYSGNLSGPGGLQVLGPNATTSGGGVRLGGPVSPPGIVNALTNSAGFNTGQGGGA
ncbi:MAG: hypothetical protein LAT83_20615, partial [Kiritimatiellae bacterium]|nr:hypothetical protein [Kiritimatiellia bacterium]